MPLQIFLPESTKKLSNDFLVDPRHIFKVLDREFQKHPTVGIYGLENWLVPSTAIAFHADTNYGLFFKPQDISLTELSNLIDTHKIFVICTESGKFQFTGKNIKIDSNGLIVCEIPNDLYAIQRRESFRITPPVDESFKLIVGLGAGQELLTNIVDVSKQGLQLDMRAKATEVSAGGYWHTCYFERLSSRSANFNLQIKHFYQGNDIARLRVGCELYDPTKQTLREFENLVDTIVRARAVSNLKKWYLDLSWWKGQSI
jgi:hypothetical protein